MMRKFFFRTFVSVFLTFCLVACRNEAETLKNENHSEHQKSFISFKEFYDKTKLSNEFLRSTISSKSIDITTTIDNDWQRYW